MESFKTKKVKGVYYRKSNKVVEIPIIKFILSDDSSLHCYLKGEFVPLKKIGQRLLGMARNYDRKIPDHFYSLLLELELGKQKYLGKLIAKCVNDISSKFLRLDSQRVVVHDKIQPEIQQLLPFIPPLVLQAALFLNENRFPGIDDKQKLYDFYYELILPNCRYTAIPSAESHRFSVFTHSLCDLHVHLNGAVETDIAWQDFLANPSQIYKNLRAAFNKYEKVPEQLEQESHLLSPLEFYRLLKIARRLRQVLYDYCVSKDLAKYGTGSFVMLLNKILTENDVQFGPVYHHPFRRLLPKGRQQDYNRQACECLLFTVVLSELKKGKLRQLDCFFHFYLLIYGLANRLLVQQLHQYGFDQFQKNTLNNLRDLSEERYENRFLQMFGNQLNLISAVEGRFSPKSTQQENMLMISKIKEGWQVLRKKRVNEGIPQPELKLVAHFIKRKDKPINRYIRHKNFRIDLWKRASILKGLLTQKRYRDIIVGIDAASNEFDAPAEVFAPVFRNLRNDSRNSLKFTYHVGEDFFHPISGLRAIYEAVDFTGLLENDRIGHGTAMGINISNWLNITGRRIFMRCGEHLDNLIFLRFFRGSYELDNEIQQRSLDIYGRIFSINELIGAWQFRRFCPILAFALSKEDARRSGVFNESAYNEILPFKGNSAFEAFRLYHSSSTREKYDKGIELNNGLVTNKDYIHEVQLAMLEYLYNKKIIIETLPTSNVRISCARNFSEYHLLVWEKLRKEGRKVPEIVVGTDDNGIFATNLFNEYASIYESLLKHPDLSSDADKILKRYVNNASLYKF